jgi:hypothetical protein
VVDVNNIDFCEAPDVVNTVRDVVIIDHHRKTAEFEMKPKIVYIEPSASSASELLSEFLEQVLLPGALPKVEADFLLAGMLLDTKMFTRNTGVRTFSSAMYLRGEGANPSDAQAFFKMEIDDFLSEASFESNVVIYKSVIAIALNEDDIDFQAREIRVNKTYSLVTRKISTTKTETSTRNVSMQDELYECCLEIIRRKWNIAAITGKSSELFFPDPNLDYICYDVYAKYFRENTEKIIGRRLTPHALRHTHVALLAENGVPLEVISRRLGHADSSITRDIYFHVTKRLAQQDADLIKSIKIV